jgi:fatty-acyl-CoA synthase
MEPERITRDMTIGEALDCVARRHPRRLALVEGEVRITYRQMSERARHLAQSLDRMGIQKGDRIATLLWNEAAFIYLFFATAKIGATIAPLSPRQRRDHLEHLLRELQPKLVVASKRLELEGGLETLREIQRELPCLQNILLTDASEGESLEFNELLEAPTDEGFHAASVDSQDLLAILYTSGTTALGKGVMHSHRSLISPVVASTKLREMWMMRFPTYRLLRRWLRVLFRYGGRLIRAAGRQQVFLSAMMMHTISGLEAMLQALLMGDRLVLLQRFHPVHALESIQRERVTVFIGMPMAYAAMLRVSDFKRYRLSSLLICGVGAAPCPPELAREIQNRFGCAVHIGFGMTELGGGIAATSLEDAREDQAQTVGRAMPGMEIRIVDEEGQPLPPDCVGELVCRGDGVTLGYFGGEYNRGQLRDREGWFHTGDLATMDEAGYIRIVGRVKDMIIRGGQNIYPAKIENQLIAISGVREAAVVGVSDSLGGEMVWAYVIPEDDARIAEEQILAHCRQHLEVHEIPQQVRLVADFPRTSNGKPQKFKLRQMAMEQGGGKS